jgi:hypothetical protein
MGKVESKGSPKGGEAAATTLGQLGGDATSLPAIPLDGKVWSGWFKDFRGWVAPTTDAPFEMQYGVAALCLGAEAELKVVARLDPILRIDKEMELHRKAKILNRLLPTKDSGPGKREL